MSYNVPLSLSHYMFYSLQYISEFFSLNTRNAYVNYFYFYSKKKYKIYLNIFFSHLLFLFFFLALYLIEKFKHQ